MGRSVRELEEFILLAKKYGITTMNVEGISFQLPSEQTEVKTEGMPTEDDLLFYSSELDGKKD